MADLFRLILSGFCFGTIGIFVKYIGSDISSIFLASLRLLVTPMLILAYLLISGRLEEVYFSSRKTFVIALLSGVFGFGPTFGLYVSSFRRIPVSEAVFLYSVAFPLSTIMYKNLKDKGSVKIPEWLALAIALTGISMIYGLGPVLSAGRLVGYTYAFSSGMFYAVSTVSLKALGENRTLLGTIFWPLLTGGIFLFPFSFLEGPVFTPETSTLLSLSGLILISTFLGYLMMAWGMRRVDAHLTSIMLILTEPLAAVLLAWLTLCETPGLSVFFGGFFVVGAGLVLNLTQVSSSP